VLELHAIAVKKAEGGGRFQVAMTAQEKRRFLDGISRDLGACYNMLGRVNVERSECSRAADRESIHAGIRDSVGFGALGRMVFGVMEGWMVEELRAEVAAKQRDGDERGEMRWSCVMGSVLKDQGRREEAVEFEERALEISRRVLSEDDAGRGVCMNNLAATYSDLGRHEDALAMEESVLELCRRALPPDHPHIGTSMSNLAATYSALGRHEDALAMEESVLEFRRRVLRPDHPHISTSMSNLAATYSALGRHEDALAMEESVLELCRRALPPDHPHIGTSMSNLAATYSALGRHEDALAMEESVLEFRRRVLRPDHPHISTSMSNLAATYSALGRHEDALAMEESVLEFRRRVLRPDHPDISISMIKLAATYSALGRHEDALAMEESVLEFRRRVLRPDHPHISTSMSNLAATYSALGRHEDALAMEESVLEFRRRVLRPDHPDISISMIKLAATYSALGRHEDALAMEESVLEFHRRVLPSRHPSIATSLYNISLSYEQAGDMRRAMDCAREAVVIWQAALPPGHPHLNVAEENVLRLEKRVHYLESIEEYSMQHAAAAQHFQKAGSVSISRHRGKGCAARDYMLQFVGFNTFVADVQLKSGCFYYEMLVVEIDGGAVQFGFCSDGFEPREHAGGEGAGDDAWSWGVCGLRQLKWHAGSSAAFGSEWRVGDVIGFALDMRAAGGAVLSVSVNGSFAAPNGVAFSGINAFYLSPALSGNGRYQVNFGDRAFEHPLPSADFMSCQAGREGCVTAWLRSMGAVGVMHIEPQTRCFEPEGAEAALQLEAAFIRTAPLLPLVTVTAPPTSTRSWLVWRPAGNRLRFCCKSLGYRDVPHDMYKLNKRRCILRALFLDSFRRCVIIARAHTSAAGRSFSSQFRRHPPSA
jgi:tetratricopeptide (TPR) repeat protein